MEQEKKKLNMEALLACQGTLQIEPQGYSMYPLFVPGRDFAVVEAYRGEKLKRGDVVVFRREASILVMHRIWKVKEDGLYLVGDNQEQIEGPVLPGQVRGILVRMIRKGKEFTVRNVWYRMYARIWLFLRPVRPYLKRPVALIKRKIRAKKQKS